MGDEKAQDSGATADALPMQSASPVAYVVGAAVVLVVGGLLVFGMSGADEVDEKEPAAEEPAGLTKEELAERQAHLRRTQAALLAVAAEDAEESKKERKAEQQQQSNPTQHPSRQTAPSPGPKPVDSGKTSQSLDALGADITSALE